MKKYLMVILLANLSFFLLLDIAKANNKQTAQTIKYFNSTISHLPIYINKNGELLVVGYLEKGEAFEVKRDVGNWYEINFGYLNSYVWKESTSPVSHISSGKVGNSNKGLFNLTILEDIPVYDNSNGELIKIATLKKGISYPANRKLGNWYEISVGGKIGYVYHTGVKVKFTSEMKYFMPTEKNVQIVINNNGKLKAIGKLEQSQYYERVRDLGNWHEIKLGDKTGYVWKEATEPYLAEVAKNNIPESVYTATVVHKLSVYDNSTGELVKIGELNEGTVVPFISKKGNWYEISVGGRVGYVYHTGVKVNFTSKVKYFKPTATNVQIVINRNGKLIPIGKLEKSQYYERVRDLGNWHEIKLGDKTGYVWKEATEPYLDEVKKSNIRKSMYTATVVQKLPIYDNSTGELEKIGELKEGTKVSFVSKKGNWYEISVGGRVGYVYHTGVKVNFTSKVKYFKPTAINVQIVINRNGKLIPIGKLEKSQYYERVRDLGNWHEIKLGDKTGYVWKEATEPYLGTETSSTSLKSSYLIETISKASVYDNSTGSLVEIGFLEPKTVLYVVGKYGNWTKLMFAGRVGYIHNKTLQEISKDIVNPFQEYSYEQMRQDIVSLRNTYPGLIETKIIGQSVDGRNIYALKLGKGDVEIFLNASHHAREHITTNLLMEMIDTYSQAYVQDKEVDGYKVKEILNKTSVWFVPMVNPDGVTLVQEGHLSAKNPQFVLMLNGYSRDFRSWKANIRGVDLNRQYPADWENIKYNTGKPGPKNYKGTTPLSEPEALAIYNFTNRHKFKIAAAYHSSGEILYWNFHQDSSRYQRDLSIANIIKNKTGYRLVYPGPNPSGGGFTDWFILTHKKPGFTPEVSPYVGERPVPIENFNRIWNQNKGIGLMLALEAYNNKDKW